MADDRNNSMERALLDIHRGLFPERYFDEETMEAEGFRTEWDAGTIEWVAEALENLMRGIVDGVELDPNFRPPARHERIAKLLLDMEDGATIEIGNLSIERRSENDYGVWCDGDRSDERLLGAVCLIEDEDDEAVEEAIA